jgi:hypothetical protein
MIIDEETRYDNEGLTVWDNRRHHECKIESEGWKSNTEPNTAFRVYTLDCGHWAWADEVEFRKCYDGWVDSENMGNPKPDCHHTACED